jgi:hypothetical protein
MTAPSDLTHLRAFQESHAEAVTALDKMAKACVALGLTAHETAIRDIILGVAQRHADVIQTLGRQGVGNEPA